jgi:hypothetical protein
LHHLASLALAHAYSSVDASLALLIATYANVGPLPATGAQQTTAADALSSYLADHGRLDLARRVRVWSRSLPGIYQEIKARQRPGTARYRRDSVLRTVLSNVDWARNGTSLVFLLGGLAALALTALSRPVAVIRWPTWGWITVTGVCAAVTFGIGAIWRGEAPSPEVALVASMARQLGVEPAGHLADRPWGLYYALICLPLLLLATLAIVLLHHRRHPLPQRGFIGHYVGTVVLVLLPICAALSLATFSLVIPAARRAAIRLATSEKLIAQGEVSYFHFDRLARLGRSQ